jgi:hypothetical protein
MITIAYFMCTRFLTISTNTIFLQPGGFHPSFGLVCAVICQVWFLLNPTSLASTLKTYTDKMVWNENDKPLLTLGLKMFLHAYYTLYTKNSNQDNSQLPYV